MKCEVCGLELPFDDEECPFCGEDDGGLFLKEQLDSSAMRASTLRVPRQGEGHGDDENGGKPAGRLRKGRNRGGGGKPPSSAWK